VKVHSTIAAITDRIRSRSQHLRSRYLDRLEAAGSAKPLRGRLSCTNLAHSYAASPALDKIPLRQQRVPNIGIVSAYNDMLSAHKPYETYPEIIRAAARGAGATAQFAGGVPAMCDGVTQGQDGMDLSLFSRDVIAMSTAIALSHNVFDGALCLGICDKIVPGLLIGALQFSHLPTIFVPGGPMGTGLSNKEKVRLRQLHAEGKLSEDELLAAEEKSYHGSGTCTFYGTANSNQMLMEFMGLHLPGSAFVSPVSPLRTALTEAATHRVAAITALGKEYIPIGKVIDEKAIVNGLVGLMTTGGSTNHAIHMVAIARAAGILIDWSDFSEISSTIPLLAKVYPNGSADVNQFHAAGGTSFLIDQLLNAGMLHDDVLTVAGKGLSRYAEVPTLADAAIVWSKVSSVSADSSVVSTVDAPFQTDGGMRLLSGNLGRAVIKVSAVLPAHRVVEAPAVVFDSQDDMLAAFKRGELERDFVAVVRYQGPRANGMPELHKLVPSLGVLQDRGFRVALVTDGRMSGASGKVPAAIHVTPECLSGGPLSHVRDGDIIRVDAETGTLAVLISDAELAARTTGIPDMTSNHYGSGRELFGGFRKMATGAEQGAMSFLLPD
jgi:phosphogluconate dehydratase